MRYHWLAALFFLIVVPLVNFATPLSPWDDMHVKHTWHAVPVDWESLGHPAASTTIDLYIALKAEQENALIDALSEVSDPSHPRYGKHLLKEQVAELVRPPSGTLELVRAWLLHHGIRPSSISTTHGGAWLTVTDVLVSQANPLLGATYQLYRNTKTNETITRTVGYALPAVLHTQIEDIAPTTYFASGRVMQRQTPRRRSFGPAREQAEAASGKPVTARSASRAGLTPSFLRWLYSTTGYTAAATGTNKLGVVGFAGEYPSQRDLTRFTTSYDTYAADAAFTVVQVSGGGYDPDNPSERSNTNVQYAATMGYPTPLTFYSVGYLGDPFLTFLDYLVNQPNIPQTIVISYVDMEVNIGPGYATAVCNLFAQLGLRGVSVLVSTGIDGVGAGNCVGFISEFPASCPWVTSVGGTTNINPEYGASFSGGGFSTHFPRPPYQTSAVPRFLQELGGDYQGRYNYWGRGYPDISAQSFEFTLVLNNHVMDTGGTSCAVSTVAGIVSLLNDFLISKRKPTLGFLNPWLYGDGLEGFNDVIKGSNPGCNTRGFNATYGWDPVTGLGTPEFRRLLKAIVAQLKLD